MSNEDKQDDKQNHDLNGVGAQTQAPTPAVRLDVERYLPMTDGFDLSDAQKIEFLQTLWSLLVTAADIGLGVDPVQMLLGTNPENPTTPSSNAVNYTHSNRQQFECAAASSKVKAGKDSS